MALQGSNDKEKLESLCKQTYKQQSVWFLNAFWPLVNKDAENFWSYVKKCIELDLEKKADGCDLDEFQAHRFLEHFKESMTVQAMRDRLRSTGAIGAGHVKRVPLTHMLTFKYNVDWKELVNAVQGDQEEIRKAQKMLDDVNSAFSAAESRKEEAVAALQDAQQRERELKAAKIELEAALGELKAQEEAYNNKTEDLKRRSEEGGVVQKNKAKNELAQHLAEDPLPLRKAKITQEAAVKKTERAAIAAEAAAREAERAAQAAEEAVEEARKKVDEAEAYLEKAKNSLPHGGVWWMERELHEAKSYLPKNKGGFNPREK